MIKYLAFMEQWLKFGFIAFITSFIWSPSRDGLEASYVLFFLMPSIFLVFKNDFCVLVKKDRLVQLILAFGIYATVTVLWNNPEDIYFFLLQFFILSAWIIGSNWLLANNRIDLRKLLLILIYLGSITSLITVITFYQERYEDVYHFEVRLTCWCSAESANLVGALYGILALISYTFFLSCDTNRERIKFGLISTILLLPLIFSQSRGALVAFFISTLASVFILRPKAWLVLSQFIIASFTVGLFIFINYSNLLILWADRTRSAGQRDLIWNYVFGQSLDNFFIGIGLSQNTKIFIASTDVVHHAHNSWLDTFYRTGAIGLLLILTITFILMKRAISSKTIEGKTLFIWLLFGLCSLTFDHRILFWEIDSKWFFYWIPAAFIISLHNQRRI